jgi:hypothetical protein
VLVQVRRVEPHEVAPQEAADLVIAPPEVHLEAESVGRGRISNSVEATDEGNSE